MEKFRGEAGLVARLGNDGIQHLHHECLLRSGELGRCGEFVETLHAGQRPTPGLQGAHGAGQGPQPAGAYDARDLAALSPLLTAQVTPFGRFDLDLESRLPLKAAASYV